MTNPRRASVRDELLMDLAAVTSRVVAAIRREVPAYDALTTAQLEEVQEIAAWGVGRVLEAWVDDTALTEHDLRRFHGIGAARAMDGRPLLGVLRAYRIAGSEVTEAVRARASGRLDVDDAISLARLWMASIDSLSEALYAGHTAATERLATHPDRALVELLDDLLTGRHATGSAVAARSRQLDVVLPPTLTVLTAVRTDGGEVQDHVDPWREVVRDAAVTTSAVLHGVRSEMLVAVTGPVDRPRLDGGASEHGWRLVVQSIQPEGVARQHRAAAVALRLAPARAPQLLDTADVTVLLRLGTRDEVDVAALREQVLAPIAERPELLQTLQARLATGSATGTAEVLECHVQTVRHRLRRIRDLTGRNMASPWDRFVMESALLICHTE